jgi:cytochrome c oxidase cbb3-type subunit 3/ubiquinol-cytochrome c reductase cytochrome c subunit
LLFVVGACVRRPAPPEPVVEKGRHLYARYCATCHGPAANGYVADNAPSLRSPTFLASATTTFLKAAIVRGRPGTSMGAYGRALAGPLDAADVDALVAFLRDGGPRQADLAANAVAGNAGRGKPLYETLCQRCHGSPTQRSTAVHLANPVFLETASDQFLRWAIVAGRPPTSMISWNGALRSDQIDDVIAYVRSMARPSGAPAAAITAIPPAAPVAPADAHPPGPPPAAPRTGPVVIHPRGRAPDFTLKEDRFVSIDQVKQALDQKRRLIIADARPPADWSNLHITGAISVPYYDEKALDDIPNDGTWVLAYCGCPHHLSGELVDHLRKRGYRHTAVIDEGIFAWQQKGYPVVAPPGAPKPAAPPPPVAVPPPPVTPAPQPPPAKAPVPSRPARGVTHER